MAPHEAVPGDNNNNPSPKSAAAAAGEEEEEKKTQFQNKRRQGGEASKQQNVVSSDASINYYCYNTTLGKEKKHRLEEALRDAEQELARKQRELSRKQGNSNNNDSSSTGAADKKKLMLSAGDIQRRREHMHHLTSGIAVTNRKALNSEMWTPGTSAYRQRLYDQIGGGDGGGGSQEKQTIFEMRKILGLDKTARCRLCEAEFEKKNLSTTVTFKRIFDLRAKWKREAVERDIEDEERRREHELADRVAKERAELVRLTAQKVADLAAFDSPLASTRQENLSDEDETAHPFSSRRYSTRRSLWNQDSVLDPSSSSPQQKGSDHQEVCGLPATVMYAPCKLCRFCAQFVEASDNEEEGRKKKKGSSPEMNTITTFETLACEQQNVPDFGDLLNFPSSCTAILQIPYRKRESSSAFSLPSSPKTQCLLTRRLSNHQNSESNTATPQVPILKEMPRKRRNNTHSCKSSSPPTSERRRRLNLPGPSKPVPVAYPLVPPSLSKHNLVPILMTLGDSDCD